MLSNETKIMAAEMPDTSFTLGSLLRGIRGLVGAGVNLFL